MQTFDGKSGIIFDSMNEEWKWNPSGEIGKDFIRTNVTDCQGKTFKIYQVQISRRYLWRMVGANNTSWSVAKNTKISP